MRNDICGDVPMIASKNPMQICRIMLRGCAAVCLLTFTLVESQLSAQPLAKGQTRFLGSSIAGLRSDFTKYFNQVTSENDGKWGSVEGTQGAYNWTALDNAYNLATTNHFPYKHHNLVWGQQQPSWIAAMDSATARTKVERWIDTVAQRYPSTSLVDVVNEPFHAVPSYSNALGGSGKTGWDWVVTTFQWARKYYFPGVKLLINEYNVLQDNTVTTNYIKLVDTLMVRGLIDGIGIQGHYFEFKGSGYTYSITTLRSNLNRLAALGLPIYISELDINEPNDSVQLANYKTYFPLFWEHPMVKGITLWGYAQFNIWKTDAYLVRSDASERPALQWLRIYVATPTVVSPVAQADQPRDVTLVWRPSTPATSYRLQIAADSAFSSIAVDSAITDTSLHVNPLAANTKYYWHVSAVNSNGASAYSAIASFTTGNQTLAVEKSPSFPTQFELLQNYPNPFNPATRISYIVPTSGYVSLKVFTPLGKEVCTLFEGIQRPGTHTVTFEGSSLVSGVYFCRMKAMNFTVTKKLILLK